MLSFLDVSRSFPSLDIEGCLFLYYDTQWSSERRTKCEMHILKKKEGQYGKGIY